MKKIIPLIILMSFVFSGCSLFQVHKLDIEQGNIITQENVSRLHIGMTEAQVKQVMGNPVLLNIFSPNRLDYVYTFQAGHGERTEKRLTLIFVRGRLQSIQNG